MKQREVNGVGNGKKSLSNGHSSAKPGPAEPVGPSGVLNHTILPILLMAFTPNLVMVLWYTERFYGGSYYAMSNDFLKKGLVTATKDMWSSMDIGTPMVSAIILGYSLFQIIIMKILPGPRAEGPVTPKGNIPVYCDNGFACYVVTMITFSILTYVLKQYGLSPTVVYDHLGEFLITLTIYAALLCVVLMFKGWYLPSTSDHGTTGHLVFDYYWGTELYPRIFGIDMKVFTNCRFGMTVWPLLVCIYAIKSYELHGFVDSMWVSALLQMTYFTKFFWWEAGYMRTIDIMVDRAGYYICWGCVVYVPGLYASVSLYLVQQNVVLGPILSAVITFIGLAAVAINYIADWQKQEVRSTNGQCIIWGRKPEVIRAKYTVQDGKERESLLLVSGWWGVSRHFHYVPELTLAFCWTVPALFHNLMPYSYLIFLFILLTHRTLRDDEKCAAKYKSYWKQYQERVPYRMIPGIF